MGAVFTEDGKTALGYAVNYGDSVNIFIETTQNSLALMDYQLLEMFAIIRVAATDPVFEANINPDAVLISTYNHAYLNPPNQFSLERRGSFALNLRDGILHRPRFWL